MVLTNRHILLTVDFEPDPGMTRFIAPLAALPKKREAELTFDGSYIRTIEPGQPTTVTEPIKEYYPAWKRIMPEIPDERPGYYRHWFRAGSFYRVHRGYQKI